MTAGNSHSHKTKQWPQSLFWVKYWCHPVPGPEFSYLPPQVACPILHVHKGLDFKSFEENEYLIEKESQQSQYLKPSKWDRVFWNSWRVKILWGQGGKFPWGNLVPEHPLSFQMLGCFFVCLFWVFFQSPKGKSKQCLHTLQMTDIQLLWGFSLHLNHSKVKKNTCKGIISQMSTSAI